LGNAVIDHTGLTDKYDVDLHYDPGSTRLVGAAASEMGLSDILDMAILDAVEKQLGLKLEAGKAP
jgi:uncharacterized protein (TIGR03435 family)